MCDSEEVVLAVLQKDLRPLGLVVDAVGREDRREKLPLGKLLAKMSAAFIAS